MVHVCVLIIDKVKDFIIGIIFRVLTKKMFWTMLWWQSLHFTAMVTRSHVRCMNGFLMFLCDIIMLIVTMPYIAIIAIIAI